MNNIKLKEFIVKYPYQAYSYSYPHKNSYRSLHTPLTLDQVWHNEDRSALFLYLHIPFCEMRCGFCNLFTHANPKASLTDSYLQALIKQIQHSGAVLPNTQFARFALGGGTPSLLTVAQLAQLFEALHKHLNLDLASIPACSEVSPYTASADKLNALYQHGIDRISIGIQSFFAEENKKIGRHQPEAQMQQALDAIRAVPFSTLNIDLIYGIPGQTEQTWRETLVQICQYEPEEIYLYPLYIRPLTGIGKKLNPPMDMLDRRKQLYHMGRNFLRAQGYTQISMRMFRKQSLQQHDLPKYRCQEDGMLGLGAGARSYTRALHYSSRYAVNKTHIRDLILDYIQQQDEHPGLIDYGVALDQQEQSRRYIIMSLLDSEGLNLQHYAERFECELLAQYTQLNELFELGFANQEQRRLKLTARGLEYSDSIGPWLYSTEMQQRTQNCPLQ